MKMTVVTNSDGTIIGFSRVSTLEQPGKMQSGLLAGPGQTLHELDVPNELAGIESGEELQKQLQQYLKQYTVKKK